MMRLSIMKPPADAVWKPWFLRELGGPKHVYSHGDVAPWNMGIFRNLHRWYSFITVGSTSAYLVLNGVFLAQYGFTNPQQGGQWRVALIVLLILTVALSVLLGYRQSRLSKSRG